MHASWLHHLAANPFPACPAVLPQVFSLQQGRRDIDAIYSMGLFEDVAMRPQPAEGSSLEDPKVGACLGDCIEDAAHCLFEGVDMTAPA